MIAEEASLPPSSCIEAIGKQLLEQYMKQRTLFLLVIIHAVILAGGQAALAAGEEVCKSYINMFCVRCHTPDRICEGLGVKTEAQWQETIKLMSEYGNLDKDVQDKVYECVTTAGSASPIACNEKAGAINTAMGPVTDEGRQTAPTQVPSPQEKIFKSIGPQEAMRMLQTRDDVIFLDVRTEQERSYGAIPGSKLVSIYDLLKGKIVFPKEKPILLVCAVGGRSYVAGQVMSKQGYGEVYNLSGGVKGWYQAGLPIVQDPAVAKPPGK